MQSSSTNGGLASGSSASVSSSTVMLNFAQPLDSASASDVSHYSVTVNNQIVAVQSAAYASATNTVTLQLSAGALHTGDSVAASWNNLQTASGGTISGQTTVTAG